jgi:hypothetical protein
VQRSNLPREGVQQVAWIVIDRAVKLGRVTGSGELSFPNPG